MQTDTDSTNVLDPDVCWNAIASRDARFDGTFFTGVLTTGIYCRPVCPARTPHRKNVQFFPCAAAAEQAGFRPCRRCRPETAPGSPAWSGTSSTVTRALRLIDEGALDTGDVNHLAERLGVGERHLRRLFDHHLGAAPIAVAQTRRVHFARLLLDGSDLPVSDIAAAAGFSSLRRFHSAFRETFGRTPGALRASSRDAHSNGTAGVGGISLHLAVRAPYDWNATFAFLGARAISGVESVMNGVWRRAILARGRVILVEASPDAAGRALHVRLSEPPGRDLAAIVERVRRVFDLGANPREIAAHLSGDPLLRPLVRARPGLRQPTVWDPFEACVRAIVGQQISVKAATTILGRIARECGTHASGFEEWGITHVFPAPLQLAEAKLATAGLPASRRNTILELSRRIAEDETLLNGEDAATRLREIRGIGDWTVSYLRLRGFGDPDVFLSGDLGVRRALAANGQLPKASDIEKQAEAWRPWRSYAVLYLWTKDPVPASSNSAPARSIRREKEKK
ncbi:MAG TPA: AlkA N-terminal domain-containing protein [bacterium]|nr:AlkA N-terminal domain-containing protein [bacterium]